MTEKLLSGLRSIEVGDIVINSKPLQDAADLIEQLQEQLKDSLALNVQQHDQIMKFVAQQASVPSVPDGFVHIDEVKQLCRDYSSRTNNVYIKDVESSLDAMALRAQEKVDG